ncbi:MAG: thioredoxin family protein [Cytophagales bacterium]|nr:thioredoxin family protein [Armatimonadota bacterium]
MSSTTNTATANSAGTQKATFYHAGCPVCISAEERVARALDPKTYAVEIVHLGDNKVRVSEAEAKGVKSVPALVIGDDVFHVNFGASLDALK